MIRLLRMSPGPYFGSILLKYPLLGMLKMLTHVQKEGKGIIIRRRRGGLPGITE
jgi:hypothetical protein